MKVASDSMSELSTAQAYLFTRNYYEQNGDIDD